MATEMTHALILVPEAPPLEERDGIFYIGGTRVTLSSVLTAYKGGSTAEDLQRKFPTLQLADIHSVIAYYLRHREEVDAYLERRRLEAEEIRRKIEELCPHDALRERMLARRDQKVTP